MIATPRVTRVGWLVMAFLIVLPTLVLAQATTGRIRGRLTSTAGQPVDAAEITATNAATGAVFRTRADDAGRYTFPTLPIGSYNVRARRIGFAILEQQNIRVRLGETTVANFEMAAAAATLEAVTVVASTTPLIDPDQTGLVDLVSARQVEAIPTNGRNFADLVALSPAVAVNSGDGTGGNLSLGGGRRGANLIQIDGAGTTGTFFGGEARGSDRIPFAFSIETVQEFQVVTNAFDVEYGFFSGGVINAVTKSGANDFHGSVFGYFRDDAITRNDFFGRDQEFSSRQIGGTLSGPLIRDKLHFYLAIERQDRSEPILGVPAPGEAPDTSRNIHPDSVARYLDILSRVYGVSDTAGSFQQTQDEWSVFARIDWQINDAHRLSLRHNFTDLEQLNDRINPDELKLNGGIFENTGNSTVLSVTSIFGPSVWNEFRAQIAFEPRPREANTLLPEMEVTVTSDFTFPDTVIQRRISGVECCNDPVLPNNLEETTIELQNNLNFRVGDHTLKLGAHFNNFDYLNFFFFRQQGRFRFRSLADFEAGDPVRDFQRALPNPGPDGEFFTGDDVTPLAEYQVREFAVYAQDQWDATDRLSLTGGVRFDFTSFPDAAPLNQDLLSSPLMLRTDVKPSDNNISPRFGFTYDVNGTGRSVVRGGVGIFFGRFPAVLYSNSLLNQGENQIFQICFGGGADVPVIEVFQNFDPNNPDSSVPTGCEVGGFPGTPNVNVFDPAFEYPRTWKANLGFEQALSDFLKFGIDVAYSKTDNNFYVEDRNLLGSQFTSGIESRPVFAPADEISTSSGSPGFGDNRVTSSFADGLVHVSTAESRSYQVTFSLEHRFNGRFTAQAGYTYSNVRDNSSYSCCISSTALFETATAGNPNFLGDPGDETNGTWGPAEFDRPHTFVLSGEVVLPADFSVSGFLRSFSGRPWTPVIDGDANADGREGNDRAFISSSLNFDDAAVDGPLLQGFLDEWACLRDQLNTIATRNSCRNSRFSNMDIRIRKRFRTVGSQRLELIADLFNVFNLLNKDWSRNVGVTGSDTELFEIVGFDPADNTYIYSVNPSFGSESDLNRFRTEQFSLQLGVKYAF